MSQEKAQLIAPQGHFTVPGLNVAGVVTASSFSGNCTGTASSIAQGTNVVVGVMTASSFAGDVFGNAAGLSTTTAGLKLGIVTATSFGGNFTGIGSGLTGTPNIVAGLVTASQFVGNTPGLAAGISAGKNLAAGIVTATTFHGDGSNLTGAGSTAYIRQTVNVTSDETTINLNNGNIIYFNQDEVANTTVSFANTTTASDVTLIRDISSYSNSWNISYATGGVTFDGTDDGLSMATDSDWQWGTGAWTVEFWMKTSSSNAGWTFFNRSSSQDSGLRMQVASGVVEWNEQVSGNDVVTEGSTAVDDDAWHHVALCRGASGDKTKLYIDGKLDATGVANRNWDNTNTVYIGRRGSYNSGAPFFNGTLSNYRVNKGNAVYTSAFTPPTSALTNISGTVFLALQSTTDDTAATVIPTGSITAESSPTPGAHTITNTGMITVSDYTITWPSSVTWNGGSAPTLASLIAGNDYSKTGQVFNLVTADGGVTWYGYEEVKNTIQQPSTLWAWGQNSGGYGFAAQLGLNSQTDYSSPVQIPGTNWATIGSNSYFSVSTGAIKTDGTLWMWGINSTSGALGQNNTTHNYSSPIQIPGTTWAAVETCNNTPMIPAKPSTMAVKTDGTLWSWGYNQSGRLGQNQAPGNSQYSSPTQIGSDTDWAVGAHKIAMGGYGFNLAIKTDGTLWSWGYNTTGQLGLGNKTRYSSPVQVPGTTWRSVRAAGGSTSATKTDGSLWTWGDNGTQGCLGHNNLTDYSSPKQVPGIWKMGSGVHSQGGFGVKTDGTGWAWGQNSAGNLGVNDRTLRSSPVQIPGSWEQLSISLYYSQGIKTGGTLWSWAYSYKGSLGLNQSGPVKYSSPVQVGSDTTWHALPIKSGPYKSFALKKA